MGTRLSEENKDAEPDVGSVPDLRPEPSTDEKAPVGLPSASAEIDALLSHPEPGEPGETGLRRLRLVEDRTAEVVAAYRNMQIETESLRDRISEDAEREFERWRDRLLLSSLNVLERLDRAIGRAQATGAEQALTAGLALTRSLLARILQGEGLEKASMRGLPFDSRLATVVGTRYVDSPAQDQLVLDEVETSVRVQGRIARRASVIVGVYRPAPEQAAAVEIAQAKVPEPVVHVEAPALTAESTTVTESAEDLAASRLAGTDEPAPTPAPPPAAAVPVTPPAIPPPPAAAAPQPELPAPLPAPTPVPAAAVPVTPPAMPPPPAAGPHVEFVADFGEPEPPSAIPAPPVPAPVTKPTLAPTAPAPAPPAQRAPRKAPRLLLAFAILLVVGGYFLMRAPTTPEPGPTTSLAPTSSGIRVAGASPTSSPAPIETAEVPETPAPSPASPPSTSAPSRTPEPSLAPTPAISPSVLPVATPAPAHPPEEALAQRGAQVTQLLAQAEAEMTARRYDAAVTRLDNALRIDPGNTAATAARSLAITARDLSRRRFVEGPTTVHTTGRGKGPSGFETEEVQASKAPKESGHIGVEFEPASVKPGDTYTARVALTNHGDKTIKIASLAVVTVSNGSRAGGIVPAVTREVPPGKRVPVYELSAAWGEGTTSWSMEVTITTERVETFRMQVSWK